ncbi:HTTM domain-containing protein [Bdellovibrio svalbardensis]|uniref:HTTM domain-containing protein n=1 Tax=Bdellovibrio svalbardensis TaxID=2972972 RepID=A0ABT6DJD6_9BACT|nr:HTTM domain-containing protein [Bdellovibrio svalbardensis]MDG0816624.1 HTTM domain-containing protein [Bdellovibrio svalbardensis]
MIKNLVSQGWSHWERFWFAPQNLLGLAFMRIALCGTMFYLYVIRLANLEYYTDASWIPRARALEVMGDLYRPLFLWGFWPDSMMGVAHVLLVVLLGLLTLGIGGRWIMWLAWILDAAFIQRNYAVNFGADIIAALFLFYMSFTQSCERLSILNLFRKKRVFKDGDIISSVMMRMMQVQIGVLYAYTGAEKLKGMSWWDGTALWSVMANPQMTTMNFDFLRNIPWIIPLLAYSTVIFEVYFPVMVAWKKTRYLWLIVGVFFHSGIAIFMGLGPFAMTMMSTYFLFVDPLILEQKVVSKLDLSKN